MKAFIISLVNNHDATVATRLLIESIEKTKSQLEPIILPATIPDTVEKDLTAIGYEKVKWTYPVRPEQDGLDIKTGLLLTHYPTANIQNRIACMVSHMRCWQKSIDLDENIVILEHDAIFTRQFKFSDLTNGFKGGIVGLNNPIGATRKAHYFDGQVKKIFGLQLAPWVDDRSVPQGLAGNSAYIVSPKSAKKLLDKVREVGMWPNDAIMCKQFFPWLQVVYPYYTTIQKGLKSTTTQ